MGYSFKQDSGDWTDFRDLPGLVEIDDFHPGDGDDYVPYYERMDRVYDGAIRALKAAYEAGHQYVLFRHGHSTSRPGKTTSRSQVRKAMQSKEATPYIDRGRSVQHYSVFLAAVRQRE